MFYKLKQIKVYEIAFYRTLLLKRFDSYIEKEEKVFE